MGKGGIGSTVPGAPPWRVYKVPVTNGAAAALAGNGSHGHLGSEHWRLPIYIYNGYALIAILLLDLDVPPAYTRSAVYAEGGPYSAPGPSDI